MMQTHLSLLLDMTRRDLKTRYVGTSLGQLWLVVQPLLLLLVYTLVFSEILNIRFSSGSGSVNFAFYLMAGLIVFNGIADSVNHSASVLNQNRHLLLNTALPAWVLPVIPVLSSIMIEVISVILLLIFFISIEGQISSLLWLYPVLLFCRLLFSLAVSYLVSILSVFFRDIAQALPMLLTVLLFVSPILYPLELVPEVYQPLFFWNPLTHLVEVYRGILLDGSVSWWLMGNLLSTSAVLFSMTFWLFHRLMPQARLVL